jgi:hypothetical protein
MMLSDSGGDYTTFVQKVQRLAPYLGLGERWVFLGRVALVPSASAWRHGEAVNPVHFHKRSLATLCTRVLFRNSLDNHKLLPQPISQAQRLSLPPSSIANASETTFRITFGLAASRFPSELLAGI